LSTIGDILNGNIPYLNVSVGEFIIAVIITVIVALVLFYVVLGIIRRSMERANFPPLLNNLFAKLIRMVIMLVVLLVFLSLIGFDTSSLVMAFSAIIGLVLAFGMSETVNNFVNGVMIAVNRPIEKDEYVIINGYEGTVDDVAMMFTRLITVDNKLVIIPNGKVWGEAIVNFSRLGIRRVEVDVSVAYGSDTGAVMEAALVMMRKHPLVIKEPEPAVFMKDLDDSAIVMQLRPWCASGDYWPVTNDVRTAIVNTLKETGITIPFPQMDVHIKETPGGGPMSA
jgi:small-conductance mechanosensitive channel